MLFMLTRMELVWLWTDDTVHPNADWPPEHTQYENFVPAVQDGCKRVKVAA